MFSAIEIDEQHRGFAGIIARFSLASVTAQSQHISYIPLADQILDETDGHFLSLIRSTGPSVRRMSRPYWGCLILIIKNVPFADISVKDVALGTQIAQHCKIFEGDKWGQ
jgi:hypothetical protein